MSVFPFIIYVCLSGAAIIVQQIFGNTYLQVILIDSNNILPEKISMVLNSWPTLAL